MNTPRLWQLFLLALLLWGGETLRRDLWNPDEVRYAYIAREMAQDQHWLVPFRSGEYYAHKPPYLFWAINLVSHATRMPIGRIPVRLPGLLAGVFVLWTTARLATRWAGARAAWPAVLTLCANYMF
jgi:4-amino-4-deoxy-L-arabinose transferase-like glycosyltransferase